MACKRGILILSPEAKDSEISSRESEWNAKTRFPKETDGEGKVKREKKQFSINEKRGQKFFKARLPLRIILDWQYPTPHERRGKDETPSFLSKKNADLEKILLVHDRTFDL